MKTFQFAIITASIFASGTNEVGAQWSLNGTKAYYNANNIGIGTSSPKYKLDVRSEEAPRVISAMSSATTGENIAIYGKCNSPNGYAGYFVGNVCLGGWIKTIDGEPFDVYCKGSRVIHADVVFGATTGYFYEANIFCGSGNYSRQGVFGATISGGGGRFPNVVEANHGTIGGGRRNTINGSFNDPDYGSDSTITGGVSNTTSGNAATVAGGSNNHAGENGSAIGGGEHNAASGAGSTISGGLGNAANGRASTVPGGINNTASGDYSFAAGYRAKANAIGSFVWADTVGPEFVVNDPNSFVARATGGVAFHTNAASTTGVVLFGGSGTWSSISDRNTKECFVAVDSRNILDCVAALPLTTWNYKSQDVSIRHIGPMAQDFYAAFGVGEDERHITTIDADGVALAAIQGLHQQLKEKQAEIDALKAQASSQDARLLALERALRQLDQRADEAAFN